MKNYPLIFVLCVAFSFLVLVMIFSKYKPLSSNSDKIQEKQNEQLLKEVNAQTGMPSIKNFRERKILKEIIELRDQDGLATYTYFYNEMTGALVFFGNTIGYGIPYSTQYINPYKTEAYNGTGFIIPQAEPNGLFSPESSTATWVLLVGADGKARPVYVEPQIIVSPFPLE